MPSTFKIYSSSAGSGKTYNLTKEYLKLALHQPNPEYYKTILAITFTNDAATEMKERILDALHNFTNPNLDEKARAKSENLLQTVTEEIQQDYPDQEVNVEEIRQRAAQTFKQILYNYSDFAVSTIDSFVNRVVSAFTRELRLPYNFEVDLDSQTLLRTAVGMLMDKVNAHEENKLLSDLIQHYATEKAEEGRSWNALPDELTSFAQNLLNEQVYDAVTELRQLTLEDFNKVRKSLVAKQKEIEKVLKEPAQAAIDLIVSKDIAVTDLAYGKAGIYGYFSKWLSGSFDISYTNSNVLKCIDKNNWSAGKANAFAKSQIESIQEQLVQYYQQIEEVRTREEQNHLLISALTPHLYKISVLNELEKCLQEIKKDKNTLHISEFNKRISEIVLHEPVPFIYERLGEKYNHILIDEFQDTSVLQWNNLLPLVDNSIGNGNFSMVVGDAKQAIYRWRGGEMEQILHLYQRTPEQLYGKHPQGEILAERYYGIMHSLAPADLNTNYRSSPEIINFNNNLFQFISQQNPQYPMLQAIYNEAFKQKSPENSGRNSGHIQLIFTHDDDSNYRYDLDSCSRSEEFYEDYSSPTLLSYHESNLNLVLQLVRHALEEGYAPRDIAVLSRVNYNSRQIASFLKEKGFDIISQDSLSLQFAEVINFIVALFRVFNRHHDVLARSEALYLFYKIILNHIPENSDTMEIADIANAADNQPFFEKLREKGYDLEEQETGNLSIYELTEKLIRIFDLLGKNNEAEYLFRFLDLVLEYSLKHSNNLNNFLNYWELQKEKLSISTPKNRNAITITSIHKAKGLAYPVVIVPFADWSTEPKRGHLLWSRLPEPSPVPELKTGVVTLSSKLSGTALQQQYEQELEKTFIENLNLLYVAFTRPVDRLYIIGKRQDFSKGTYQKNISYLLHSYLVQQDLWHDEQNCYQLSKGNNAQHSHAASSDNTYPLEHFASADWAQRLKLKQHANAIFDFGTQQEQRELNKKVHYALARLTTSDNLNYVLLQMQHEGIISQREKAKLELTLHGIVEHPALAHYFSDKVVVENEKEVLDARAYLYKPDRIVFDGDEVVLIEYKTLPELDEHRQNLNNQAKLFKQLGFEKIKKLLFYFDVQKVVEF